MYRKAAFFGRGQNITLPEVSTPINSLVPLSILQSAEQESVKAELKKATGEALAAGAYGAPVMLVTNKDGKTEFFFGSDRFEHIAAHIGERYVPLQELRKEFDARL